MAFEIIGKNNGFNVDLVDLHYSTEFKLIENINATAQQPQRTVLKYFVISKNVAHSLEPGETPSNSASHRLITMYNDFNYRKS